MTRRTAEETRALLLDEGVRLLLERGVTAGVQHIRLQEVLRRVGLTTGAAYRIWADQTDFQRDIAVAMVELRLDGPVDNASLAVERILDIDVSDDEIIRAASATHVDVLEQYRSARSSEQTRVFLIALALRMTADTWPELHAAALARHTESVHEFAAFYQRVAETRGYRMRTPYTLNDFAEAMAALGEGFAIRAAEGLDLPMLDIDEGDEAPTGRWSLFGVAARGLVNEFMVRDTPAPRPLKRETEGREVLEDRSSTAVHDAHAALPRTRRCERNRNGREGRGDPIPIWSNRRVTRVSGSPRWHSDASVPDRRSTER